MAVTDEQTTTSKELARLKGHALVNKVKELIHEGNVRRITIPRAAIGGDMVAGRDKINSQEI